jgi:hypothetical protein
MTQVEEKNEKEEKKHPSSTELAADSSLIPVWDPAVPFPTPQEMPELDIVTHVTVERAKRGGYHYLHEAAIAWHRDRFYACWANHPEKETGDYDELIRGCTSVDAFHWSEATIWIQAPFIGGKSHNQPTLFTHNDKLYLFLTCWREEHIPATEVFILNDNTGEWEWQEEATIPVFVAFCSPQRMDNGNWIIGGSSHWKEAAVAISDGDNFLKWTKVIIPRDDNIILIYPETSVVDKGNGELLAFCRPPQNEPIELTAPIAKSHDYGQTWTTLELSNFPLAPSQPFAGTLSTGHKYLLTNNLEDKRCLLTIALTDSDGKGLFRHIFKVRHQQWPQIRLFAPGKPTQLAYPNVIEHNGNLYIIYSEGKEDCALSIVPIEVLNV